MWYCTVLVLDLKQHMSSCLRLICTCISMHPISPSAIALLYLYLHRYAPKVYITLFKSGHKISKAFLYAVALFTWICLHQKSAFLYICFEDRKRKAFMDKPLWGSKGQQVDKPLSEETSEHFFSYWCTWYTCTTHTGFINWLSPKFQFQKLILLVVLLLYRYSTCICIS